MVKVVKRKQGKEMIKSRTKLTLSSFPQSPWTMSPSEEGPERPQKDESRLSPFQEGVCYLLWLYEVSTVYRSVLIRHYNEPAAE